MILLNNRKKNSIVINALQMDTYRDTSSSKSENL